MSAHSLGLTLIASALLLAAHVVRTLRWSLLFPASSLVRRFNLLLGLGIGYAINIAVPLRVGEIVRIVFVHRQDGVRLSHVAATVFVERVADLLVVAVILFVLLASAAHETTLMATAPLLMVAAGLAMGLLMLSVRRSGRLRRVIWQAASVFNDRIRVEIADFFWSLTEIVSRRTLLGYRFLCSTVVLWCLYLLAFGVFAEAVGMTPAAVFDALLNHPQRALLQNIPRNASVADGALLLLFAGLPILAIGVYGAVRDHRILKRGWNLVRRFGRSGQAAPLAARKRFDAVTTYDYFLASLFSGTNQLVSGFGLEAIDDCIIHKFFHGGSDAITALVEVDERLLIRKFATGAPGQKLAVQAQWLAQRSNLDLPLVKVVGEQHAGATYTYDMPLVTPSNDFYEVIHTSPASQSRHLLSQVIGRLVDFHALTAETLHDEALVRRYLDTKAVANARTILDFARTRLPGESYVLNGRRSGFAAWDRWLDPDWLGSQLRDRRVANIHGDLTIENIIVSPGTADGFYVIDPNPENIFDSPLIDWAKLMQSLHLGYETLNQGLSCAVNGEQIRLTHVRSQAYADLHQLLETEARTRLGPDALREIYFHEVINYLRLTTYKIRQSPSRGLGFFACTSMLLDRYAKRWAA